MTEPPTRLGAALLCLLITCWTLPAGAAAEQAIDYPERGAARVATFAPDVAWELAGEDAGQFLVADGALRFSTDGRTVTQPDFERPGDADGDNRYRVRLRAPGAASPAHALSVRVVDVDEPGAVTLSHARPALGEPLYAELNDPDGVLDAPRWQWARWRGGAWRALPGANGPAYTPTAADTGYHLRASARYADRHGADRHAEALGPHPVLGPRLSYLGARTDSDRARQHGMRPAFDPAVLHYGVPCAGADVLTLAFRAPPALRVAVNGVQPRTSEESGAAFAVTPGSDVRVSLSDNDGAETVYTVHCMPAGLAELRTRRPPGAPPLGALLTLVAGEWALIIDEHGVPRARLGGDSALSPAFFLRPFFLATPGAPADLTGRPPPPLNLPWDEATPVMRAGAANPADPAVTLRWAHARRQAGTEHAWTILDRDLMPLQTVTTTAPVLTTGRHDFRLLEDGSMLLMAYEPAVRDFSALPFPDKEGNPWGAAVATRDSVIQWLAPDGKTARWTWNSWDWLAREDCAQGHFPDDYAHVNALQWVGTHGPGAGRPGVLASFRGCSSVALIEPLPDTAGLPGRPGRDGNGGTGAAGGRPAGDTAAGDDNNNNASPRANKDRRSRVRWRLGQSNLAPADWARRGLGPAPLAVVGDPEGTFCGQHAAQLLGNGHLLLFDNGVPCVVNPRTGEALTRTGNVYSRVAEYAPDPAHGEAVFVRARSLHGRRDRLAAAGGHVAVMANGDWLVSWGRARDAVVTRVEPATGRETFVIESTGLEQWQVRALPVTPLALARAPGPLTAAFTDPPPAAHRGADDRPTLAVAFSRAVADFPPASASIAVAGGAAVAVTPRRAFGKPAHSYLLTLAPAGAGPLSVRIRTDAACADTAAPAGATHHAPGICAADGTPLSQAPPPVTIAFEPE